MNKPPAKIVREIFTKALGLTYQQRSYSWHEIQDALSECDKALYKVPLPTPPIGDAEPVKDKP